MKEYSAGVTADGKRPKKPPGASLYDSGIRLVPIENKVLLNLFSRIPNRFRKIHVQAARLLVSLFTTEEIRYCYRKRFTFLSQWDFSFPIRGG